MEDQNIIKKFLPDPNGDIDPLRTGGNFDVEDGPAPASNGARPHAAGQPNGTMRPQQTASANGRPTWGQRAG